MLLGNLCRSFVHGYDDDYYYGFGDCLFIINATIHRRFLPIHFHRYLPGSRTLPNIIVTINVTIPPPLPNHLRVLLLDIFHEESFIIF